MNGRRITPHDASKFKKWIRQLVQDEIAHLQAYKLPGVVDYISSSGSKYFADVFLNGHAPKFQEQFTSMGRWTQVVGSFSVSSGVATGSGGAQDLAIVTNSSYGDFTYVCEVDMPAVSSTQETEIIFRYQDQNNYYALVLTNNTLVLRKVSGGTPSTLASASVTLSTGTWYWLRIQAQGSRLTGWISTTGASGSWTNQIQATDSAFTSGAIGIRDVSLAAEFKLPTIYTGTTPVIPVRPGVGSSLSVGQEVFVEKINFNGQDLIVDMPRVV